MSQKATEHDRSHEIHRPESQTTNTVVMIQPDAFGFNAETAANNFFQTDLGGAAEQLRSTAMAEWESIVNLLASKGVNVITLPNRAGANTPDAVFPNNWFSHHQNGSLVLYPMKAENRRLERQPDELKKALAERGIAIKKTIDLTDFEAKDLALEGTGSLVLDRVNRIAFALESPRTSKEPFADFCEQMGYQPVFFHAFDQENREIYHTNVVMGVGEKMAVICLEAIPEANGERQMVISALEKAGKEIIAITFDQMKKYGGNILELRGSHGPIIIASASAVDSYTAKQKKQLKKYGELVPFKMPIIETIGGGSARCILAEIFSDPKIPSSQVR